jgi:hypothetical protein
VECAVGRPGEALKTALDLINMFRLENQIDNYAQGRNPWFSESAASAADFFTLCVQISPARWPVAAFSPHVLLPYHSGGQF